jgi:hypothetical protein
MPQQRRVALTMPAHLDRLFDRLSELEGKPKTKIIIEYLDSISPHAESMITALEAIKEKKSNPVEALQNLTRDMLLSMGQLGQEMEETIKLSKLKQVHKEND